jgi:hypothetical protein
MTTHAIRLFGALSLLALAACKPTDKPADFTPTGPKANQVVRAGTLAPTELLRSQSAIKGTGGRCNIERIDPASFGPAPMPVSKAKPVRVVGWIADTDLKTVPATAELRLVQGDRSWRIPVTPNAPRSDVQGVLGGDAVYAKTGYSPVVDFSSMDEGTYRLYTVFFREGTSAIACDNGRQVSIGP